MCASRSCKFLKGFVNGSALNIGPFPTINLHVHEAILDILIVASRL